MHYVYCYHTHSCWNPEHPALLRSNLLSARQDSEPSVRRSKGSILWAWRITSLLFSGCVLLGQALWDHLVKELHEDKAVEDKGVVDRGSVHSHSIGDVKDGIAVVDQCIHHAQLEQALTHNGLHNLRACGI